MVILIAGVILWGCAHLLPAIAPPARNKLIGALGEAPYKGLFSVNIVLALVLIVWGWKTATPSPVYTAPLAGSIIPAVLIAAAFILIVASSTRNNLKRHLRHPQMSAVIFWGSAHLLANGDSRSLVLFGGFTLWAMLEIVFINRRDHEWIKPDAAPLSADLIAVVVGALGFYIVARFHISWFGVPALITY